MDSMDKALNFNGARWEKGWKSLESNCVEIAHVGGGVGVRDSKNPDGPVLSFTTDEWTAFTGSVREGFGDA